MWTPPAWLADIIAAPAFPSSTEGPAAAAAAAPALALQEAVSNISDWWAASVSDGSQRVNKWLEEISPTPFRVKSHQVGWLKPTVLPTADASHYFAQGASYRSLRPSSVYLFVAGFMSEHVGPGHFDSAVSFFRSLGLRSFTVPINSTAGSEDNVAVIADAVVSALNQPDICPTLEDNGDDPIPAGSWWGRELQARALGDAQPLGSVVLICHSKGGLDVLHTLQRQPHLRRYIRGIVLIQCPFAGTPWPELIGQAGISPMVTATLRAMSARDTSVALLSLSHDSRRAWIEENGLPSCRFPVVSISTAISSATSSPLSPLPALAAVIRARYGEESDGLVTSRDSVVPGSVWAHVAQVDHAAPVVDLLGATLKSHQICARAANLLEECLDQESSLLESVWPKSL